MYLIKIKVNINAQDFDGNTALMWSVINKKQKVALFLLSKKADKTVKREDGATAFDLAKSTGKHFLTKLLTPTKLAKINIRRDRAPAAKAKNKKVNQQ